MEKQIMNSFQNLDEVQNMIRQLRMVEENMMNKGNSVVNSPETTPREPVEDSEDVVNGSDECYTIFDTVPLLDLDQLCNEMDDCWLMPTPYKDGELRNLPVDENDMSFIDSRLMSVRLCLLNYVKAAINEQRTATLSANTPIKLKRNTSYVIRRDSDLSTPTSPITPSSPHSLGYPYPQTPLIPPLLGPTVLTPQGIPITLPVITDTNYVFVSSPPAVLNSTMTYSHKKYELANLTGLPSPKSRKLSYTKERDIFPDMGESYSNQDYEVPNLNSTFPPTTSKLMNTTLIRSPRVHVTPPRVLNSTFTRSPDDISNASDSNGSLHSSSVDVDEIHSMARLQEQSLHMTSTPRRLERKETHTLARDNSLNGNRELRLSNRTLSNDTYSLEESTPGSGGSSEISSPREGQSYEDVQLASEAVRRSMPNLAFIRDSRKPSGIPPPPSSQLKRESHYVSDTKLGLTRTRTLRVPSTGIRPVDIGSIDPPRRGENTYAEAQSLSSNNKARSNTFQKPSNIGMGPKKSDERLYQPRPTRTESAGGEGNGRGYFQQQGPPPGIQAPRPTGLPAPRYPSMNQPRERDTVQQYPGIPRRRLEPTRMNTTSRTSMLPTSLYSYSSAPSARPGSSRN